MEKKCENINMKFSWYKEWMGAGCATLSNSKEKRNNSLYKIVKMVWAWYNFVIDFQGI